MSELYSERHCHMNALMNVSLISHNDSLVRLCRETLSELFGKDLNFSVSEVGQDVGHADVYIWDFEPGLRVPDVAIGPQKQKHLFVVHPGQLNALSEQLPTRDINLLLKPVTRATLSAFLGKNSAPLFQSSAQPLLDSMRTDRDEMLQCLIDVNLKLQTYDQERTNFLARAMHDFRAPLSAIDGYCGLLLAEQLGPITENQRKAFERVQHSAKRLSRMATSMFQLSIGGNVETKLRLQKGDSQSCLDQALHELKPLAEQKNLRISADLRPPTGTLYFEHEQILQVFVNLLENACKFTPKSGFVEISGYPFMWERRRSAMLCPGNGTDRRRTDCQTPNSYRIDMKDNGPGVPPENSEKIFEEYTSYAGGADRSGGGLGLAICKSILRAHQGSIWAHNSSGGAVFSFVLPFAPLPIEKHLAKATAGSNGGMGGMR
jgi:signal transduction histidine kinase